MVTVGERRSSGTAVLRGAAKAALGAMVVAGLGWAVPAAAKPLVDCPLRDAPFSVQSPLIDVLLSPAAKAVIDRAGGGRLAKMPPRFAGTTPPSFAAILSVREGASLAGIKPEMLPQIDAELRAVPVTRADKIARCARYDTVPPKLTVPAGRPRLLLFEKINGFRDGPSVDAAHAAFLALAREKNWAIVTTENGAAFTPAILRQFDAVIWNNISGDVLTLRQRRAFQDWMAGGGGFVGVHGSAGDPAYFWDWYADTLIGARFKGHPMAPQFQDAKVRIDEAAHPIARGLPAEWVMNDEWYSFRSNPRDTGSRIVATLDESTYKPEGMGGSLRMGDHPIAWTRCVGRDGPGRGRMFYSAIGHRPERYGDALYRQMLTQAIEWAADRGAKECQSAGAAK
ncbi:MAG TPA: ThuA domain-containing protein [Novosphingobium sp.]